MDLYLIVFTSGTYKMEQTYENHKELFVALEKYFTLHLVNYLEAYTIPANVYKMPFLASGGIEDKVIQNFNIFPYPITLLTDGVNNSLAAALEISAWIRSKDMKAKIIHGKIPDMVHQVLVHHQAFTAKRTLNGKRIGVIGSPASWLVASHVDYLLSSHRWGIKFIDIPLKHVYKKFHSITDNEIGVEASLLATQAQACQDTTPEALLRAMRLHKAIKQVCEEEKLDAVSLSCFSLIDQINTTGCVSLSLLNNEGIPAGCEGDLQAIVTMLMAQAVTGKPSFMGNPSYIDAAQQELVLAHCSIATKMTDQYIIRDHYETHQGVAIQGQMHEGDVTIFKCGGECLDEYYVDDGYLVENTNLSCTCRTQLKIRLAKPINYFLTNPIGNHHILIEGHHTEAIQEFMQQNQCKQHE
ncbi:fucose isomerase [uncultured Bacteroides sp.]|uniref:fucose isomerase n=1 Tax=uncultured Bacteroides sp. TaxID=162156 RepID=UPI00261ED016|nr:fucose isomerase [uncultured Bacteroides sp.]